MVREIPSFLLPTQAVCIRLSPPSPLRPPSLRSSLPHAWIIATLPSPHPPSLRAHPLEQPQKCLPQGGAFMSLPWLTSAGASPCVESICGGLHHSWKTSVDWPLLYPTQPADRKTDSLCVHTYHSFTPHVPASVCAQSLSLTVGNYLPSFHLTQRPSEP